MNIKDFKNRGVIITPPLKEDAWYHKVFKVGAVKNESFDWKPYRPKFEKQGNTSDCVNFSRCNCGEYMAKKTGVLDDDGNELNFSDLHLAVGSGTTPQGNDLNSPSEYFRKSGIVLQKYCDYDEDMLSNSSGTWEKRQMKVDKIPMTAARYKGGNHSWVKPEKPLMIDALDASPLQIAVGVNEHWTQGGVIPRCDNPLGYHAVALEKINPDGTYRIFDSTFGEEKTLASDYKIEQAKSFRDLPEIWKDIQANYEKTIFSIIGEILKKLAQILGFMRKEAEIITEPPPAPPMPNIEPVEPPKYLWDTRENSRHSIRVICDEEGLNWSEKNLICAVIECESGFDTRAVHYNTNGTQDVGIVQVNTQYWIGENKKFPSVEYILENPDVCVRWMIERYKAGSLKLWVCYSSGKYAKYLT